MLSYDYSLRGDLESKTDSASGDRNLTAYAYGTDTRLESVTVGGAAWTLHHDTSGHVTRYERPGRDDRFVKWDGRGLATEVRLAASATSATSTALDAFAYGPDGARHHRRSQWAGDGATRTEDTYYAGAYEKTHRPDGSVVERTRLGAAVHVRTTDAAGNRGEGAWEYLHRDHLGSVESVTDESGNELAAMAHDPYGDRRRPDWTGRLTASSTTALVDAQGRRASRGFTGHEHLDRTGLVHMNGRVYDPLLGRFLSPDPVVSGPGGSQGWNLYAYVGNNPLSRTDPTGLFVAGPCSAPGSNCVHFAGGGGGGWGGGTRTETVTSATQVFGVWLHRFRVWRSDWRQRWDSRRERWVFENHGAWEWLTQLIPYSTTVHASWRFVVAEEDPASEPVEPNWTDRDRVAAELAKEVYDKDGGLLESLGVKYDPKHGFAAALYQRDGQYYLAFRGSQKEWADWGTNLGQGAGLRSSQYEQAVELAKAVHEATGGNVVLIGHSLGGGLASAGAYATGADAVTFNASGLSRRYRRGPGGDIRAHYIKGDLLSVLQDLTPIIAPSAAGTRIRHDPRGSPALLGRHSIDQFPE